MSHTLNFVVSNFLLLKYQGVNTIYNNIISTIEVQYVEFSKKPTYPILSKIFFLSYMNYKNRTKTSYYKVEDRFETFWSIHYGAYQQYEHLKE